MRGYTELRLLRNIYYFVAVLILISSFVGCTAGSCLSYGHSCWGAHGKRSGSEAKIQDRIMTGPKLGDRWLFSQMMNRRLTQQPLGVRDRARILPELSIRPAPRLSRMMENFSEDMSSRDSSIDKLKMREENSPAILLTPRRKELNTADNQAIKIGIYKILRNIDDKLK